MARVIKNSQISFDVDQLAKAYKLVLDYESAKLSSVTFTHQDRRVPTPKPTLGHLEHLVDVVLPILLP